MQGIVSQGYDFSLSNSFLVIASVDLPIAVDAIIAIFIDGVDHEWCWRAKAKNQMIAIAEKVEMVHQLADKRSMFAGLTYIVDSSVRLYY